MLSPVILVGLPRSGSTLVSRIFNESLNCFIINDFYYLQYVESLGGYTKSDQKTKELLVDFIVDQVKNRTKPEGLADEVWFGLPFSTDELQTITDFAAAYKASGEAKNWSQILQDMMQFLTNLSGKSIWGYNTPQDYLNFEVICDAFADAKFIFLLRSPLATLLSYKYYWTRDTKFHDDRGRYHPVVQSLAWKTCVNTYFSLRQEQGKSRCMLIKFEDVLSETEQTLGDVSQFTGAKFPAIDLTSFGTNSSLSQDGAYNKPKRITGLEANICYHLTKKELHRLGYEDFSGQDIGMADPLSLLVTTFRNCVYYLRKILFSNNIRKRVFKFVHQMILQVS